MRNLFLYALVCAIVFGPSLVEAISLQEAKEEAVRSNLSIKVAEEMVSEAHSTRKQRYTEFFVKSSVVGYGGYRQHPRGTEIDQGEYGSYPVVGPFPNKDVFIETGKRDTYQVAVQFQQPVFAGGRIYNSYNLAKSAEQAASWDEQQVVDDILLNVEQAYLSILKAQEARDLAEKHRETFNAHLADMEVRFQKGRVALNEVLKVKVEVERANGTILKAENAILTAAAQLNLILKRPVGQPVEVTPVADPTPLAISIEEAEGMAKGSRPAVKSARAKLDGAVLYRRVVQSDYYPDLSVVSRYLRQADQPNLESDDWSVMLAVTYPFWNWGGTGHKVDAARAIERQAEYAVAALEAQLAADVNQSWLSIQDADKRMEVGKEAQIQAEENLRIVSVGFTHGVKTSTDVLDAEELVAKTRSEYLQAKYDALIARTVLRHATHRIDKTE
jgi:outer membrane protein